MWKVVSEIGSVMIVQKPFAERINGWFLCFYVMINWPEMATWMYG